MNSSKKWSCVFPVFEADKCSFRLPQLPWAGHRAFGYDLVCWLRPRVIVELGSHLGASFFSFCQAVKDNRLDCTLHAVDHWKGDEQSGHYDESVYEAFCQVRSKCFGELDVQLHRMDFAEARTRLEGVQIDMLHIDGLHDYDAVRSDFETWRPLMNPDGIVLFHDISAEYDYGSRRYWIELKQKYRTLEFHHSYGLGVLAFHDDAFERLCNDSGLADLMWIYGISDRLSKIEAGIESMKRMSLAQPQDVGMKRMWRKIWGA